MKEKGQSSIIKPGEANGGDLVNKAKHPSCGGLEPKQAMLLELVVLKSVRKKRLLQCSIQAPVEMLKVVGGTADMVIPLLGRQGISEVAENLEHLEEMAQILPGCLQDLLDSVQIFMMGTGDIIQDNLVMQPNELGPFLFVFISRHSNYNESGN